MPQPIPRLINPPTPRKGRPLNLDADLPASVQPEATAETALVH